MKPILTLFLSMTRMTALASVSIGLVSGSVSPLNGSESEAHKFCHRIPLIADREIERFRSLAADPEAARSERLQAMEEIAQVEGAAATKALVSLIGLRLADRDEHRVAGSGGSATWPTVKRIRSRGEAAVPHLCRHLLSLLAESPRGTEEIRVTILTALALSEVEAIIELLEADDAVSEFADEVIERAKRMVTSFHAAQMRDRSQ